MLGKPTIENMIKIIKKSEYEQLVHDNELLYSLVHNIHTDLLVTSLETVIMLHKENPMKNVDKIVVGAAKVLQSCKMKRPYKKTSFID